MGAPPPSAAGNNTGIKVYVQIRGRGKSLTSRAREALRGDIRAVLECYGKESRPSSAGNESNGLLFEIAPGSFDYSLTHDPANSGSGPKFLAACKAIRGRLEDIVKDRGAYVNEWNDVAYGTDPDTAQPLSRIFPGGSSDPNSPAKEPDECPSPPWQKKTKGSAKKIMKGGKAKQGKKKRK
jgi:hypothetical protein